MTSPRAPVPTTSAEQSVWLEETLGPPWPPLDHDIRVEVAVIGGGITGVTAALLLRRDGARVALVEAGRVAGGITRCTTAKVTALQSTIYSVITSHHGREVGAIYADASRAGVERVATLAGEEHIECDLLRCPAFTYAADDGQLGLVAREAEAARDAGLDVTTTNQLDLPYPVAGAVGLENRSPCTQFATCVA